MKNIILIFILFSSGGLYAQNLVPNPSFEEYEECPNAVAEFATQVIGWTSWQHTPDYFNVCNNELTGWAGVPENSWGYQFPITGDAYASIYIYAYFKPDIREYIAAPLMAPLVAGQEYYMMFYTSQYDGGVESDSWCATNHIGLRFFKDPTYNSTTNPLHPDNFAHLDYSLILNDSENWTKVEGWFTADDNYNWLALGNFFDGAHTETLVLNPEERCFGIYYIENICVSTDPSDCEYLLSAKESFLKQPKYSIYPNPASDYLIVDMKTQRINSFQVYDIAGRVIKDEEINPTDNKNIDVSDLPIGIYLLRINTNSFIINHKFYKQ